MMIVLGGAEKYGPRAFFWNWNWNVPQCKMGKISSREDAISIDRMSFHSKVGK